MEIKKVIILTFVLLFVFSFFKMEAQNDSPRKGFVVGTTTIQYGIPTDKNISPTWYITNRAEYFIEDRISLIGKADFSLPKPKEFNDIHENHQVLFGANYHFVKNQFDGYLGFQPGISFNKSIIIDYDLMSKEISSVSPVISVNTGVRYYLGWNVHAFFSANYQYGFQLTNQSNIPLSEIRLALGIGVNFNTNKE